MRIITTGFVTDRNREKQKEDKMKMPAIFALAATLLMQAAPVHAGWYSNANTWAQKNAPLDKNFHIGAGIGISHVLKQNGASSVVSMAVPATIGFIKETTDKNFSTSDLLSWIAGGIVGAIIDNESFKMEANPETGGLNLLVYID